MIDRTTSRVIFGFLVAAGLMVAVFAWYKASDAATPDSGERDNAYDADVPLSSPIPVDSRLILLTPQELAKAPLADVFVSPLGDESGAFTYVAQGIGAVNPERGGKHAGVDLNGIGGENTDEGLPVRAAGRGLLIYAGEPSPAWGNVVVLLHRLPDGRFLQSLYAHLKAVSDLPLGAIVGRGEQIGTVGTSHGHYLAHLHFEMMESIAHEAGMPGYGRTVFNRVNPDEILSLYAPDPDLMIPDPVAVLKEVQMAVGWEKLLENLYKNNNMEALEKVLLKEESGNGVESAKP